MFFILHSGSTDQGTNGPLAFGSEYPDFKCFLRIYGYAATWTANEVYMFGGYYSKSQAVIAKYDGEWTNVGELVQGRYSHAAISHYGVTLIIGGSTDNGKP